MTEEADEWINVTTDSTPTYFKPDFATYSHIYFNLTLPNGREITDYGRFKSGPDNFSKARREDYAWYPNKPEPPASVRTQRAKEAWLAIDPAKRGEFAAPRFHYDDAEYKAIDWLCASIVEAYPAAGTPDWDTWRKEAEGIDGEVNIWSSQGPCHSCRWVFRLASRDMIGVEFHVAYRSARPGYPVDLKENTENLPDGTKGKLYGQYGYQMALPREGQEYSSAYDWGVRVGKRRSTDNPPFEQGWSPPRDMNTSFFHRPNFFDAQAEDEMARNATGSD
ncbi:hypothetical protein [Streptomyces sp. 1222.5]|uniref:hypothetical protein n=1 Tax=Streptomyces sp. 1222.5 TaxID=1881026 RepID=UPI003D74DAC2